MIKILHFADLHLGVSFTRFGERNLVRSADFYDTFKRAINHACDRKNKIDCVLFVGDVFDNHNPSAEAEEIFRAEIIRLHDCGISSILVPGNHDGYGYADSIYRKDLGPVHVFKEPEVGEPFRLELNGEECRFYGLAYDPKKSANPLEKLKRANDTGLHIALLHGSIKQGMQFDIHKKYLPVELDSLADSGMDYIAMGHYHNFAEHDAGGISVVYPGTLEGKRFGEVGDRYLVEVEISSGSVKITKTPIGRRRILQAEIDLSTDGRSADYLRNHLAEVADEDILYSITVKGSTDEIIDIEAIRQSYEDRYFYLEMHDNLSIFDSSLIAELSKEQSVRGAFVRRLTDGLIDLDEAERELREIALRKGLNYLKTATG